MYCRPSFYVYGAGPILKKEPERYLPRISGLEVFNSRASLFPFSNKKAKNFYEKIKQKYPNVGAVACSDGGSPKDIGRSSSEIEMPCDYNSLSEEDFAKYLKQGVENCDGEKNITTPARLESLLHIVHIFVSGRRGLKFKK